MAMFPNQTFTHMPKSAKIWGKYGLLFQFAFIYWQSEFSVQTVEEAIALLNRFGLKQFLSSWEECK